MGWCCGWARWLAKESGLSSQRAVFGRGQVARTLSSIDWHSPLVGFQLGLRILFPSVWGHMVTKEEMTVNVATSCLFVSLCIKKVERKVGEK